MEEKDISHLSWWSALQGHTCWWTASSDHFLNFSHPILIFWYLGAHRSFFFWPLGCLTSDCCRSLSHSVVSDSLWLHGPDCSTPGFPEPQYFPEFAHTYVHWLDDAIWPSHPLSSPSPPAFNLSQHQGLLWWAGCSHQMAKVLELQHQSFQWIFRVDFL